VSAAMVVVVIVVILALGAGMLTLVPRRQSQDVVDWRDGSPTVAEASGLPSGDALPADDALPGEEEAWARFQAGGPTDSMSRST
jgi:hypothetical protein